MPGRELFSILVWRKDYTSFYLCCFAKMITIIGESLCILIRGYYMCDVMAKH